MLIKLGETRLGVISKGLSDTRDQRSLAAQCCRQIDRSKIKSEEGTLGAIKAESLLPKTNAAGKPLSLVGRRGDAHTSETLTASRTFKCERYAERRDYDDGQQLDELFREVKAELAPSIERQILFDEDLKLLDIYSGNGLAADSRDVTTYTLQAGQEFSTTATTSDPLHHMEEVIDRCGGDFIFMSRDVARALRRHPVLQGLESQNLRTPLTERKLAENLMEHLGVMEVIIGRRIYQDGGEYQKLNIAYKFSSIFSIGVKRNILRLNYSPLRLKEYEEESKSLTFLQGDHWSDIVVVEPALTYAFDNVLA